MSTMDPVDHTRSTSAKVRRTEFFVKISNNTLIAGVLPPEQGKTEF